MPRRPLLGSILACSFAVLAFLRYAAVKERTHPPRNKKPLAARYRPLRSISLKLSQTLSCSSPDVPPVCLVHSLCLSLKDSFLLCEILVYHPLQPSARPSFKANRLVCSTKLSNVII